AATTNSIPGAVNPVMNTLASATLGILWRAATGTVDPWTKQSQIEDEAAALAQAAGSDVASPDDYAQADNDVTASLISNNADPSQASFLANNPGAQEVLDKLQKLGYILLIVGAAYVVVELAKTARA